MGGRMLVNGAETAPTMILVPDIVKAKLFVKLRGLGVILSCGEGQTSECVRTVPVLFSIPLRDLQLPM